MITTVFKSSLKLNSNTVIGKEELKKINQMLTQLIGNHDSFEFRDPVDWKGIGLLDYPTIVKHPMDLNSIREKVKNNEYLHVEECLDDIQLVWDNCKNYNAEGSWIFKIAEKLEKLFKNMIKNYIPSIQFMASVVKKDKLSSKGGQDEKPSSNATAPSRQSSIKEETSKQSENSNGSQNGSTNNPAAQTENATSIFEEEDEEANDTVTAQDKVIFSQRIKQLPTEQLGMIVLMIQNSASQAFKNVDSEKCQILVDQIDPDTFKKINQQMELWNVTTDQTSKRLKV